MKTVRNVVCAMFVIAALCIILRSPEKAQSLIETSSLEEVKVGKTEKSKDIVVLELTVNPTFPQQEQPRPLSTKQSVQK